LAAALVLRTFKRSLGAANPPIFLPLKIGLGVRYNSVGSAVKCVFQRRKGFLIRPCHLRDKALRIG
jgi:hypothetical protein